MEGLPDVAAVDTAGLLARLGNWKLGEQEFTHRAGTVPFLPDVEYS